MSVIHENMNNLVSIREKIIKNQIFIFFIRFLKYIMKVVGVENENLNSFLCNLNHWL